MYISGVFTERTQLPAWTAFRTPSPRRLGEVLRIEEMKPEVPVGLDPQIPLADGGKDCRLRDGVRGEMVQLYPVMVGEPTHEAARRHP